MRVYTGLKSEENWSSVWHNPSDVILGPLKTSDVILGPLKTSDVILGPLKTSDVILGPLKTSDVILGPLKTSDVILGPLKTSDVILGPLKTSDVILGPLKTSDVILGPLKTSDVILGPLKTALPVNWSGQDVNTWPSRHKSGTMESFPHSLGGNVVSCGTMQVRSQLGGFLEMVSMGLEKQKKGHPCQLLPKICPQHDVWQQYYVVGGPSSGHYILRHSSRGCDLSFCVQPPFSMPTPKDNSSLCL
ncbi:hypothetical protein ACOMHN_053864 [Nucella lapillus]